MRKLCILMGSVYFCSFVLDARAQDYGQYFCRIDHAAITAKNNRGLNYSGELELSEDRRQFYMTLRPIRRDTFDAKFCRQSVDVYLDMLDIGKSFPAQDSLSGLAVQDRESFGYKCLTRDEAIIHPVGTNTQETLRAYQLGLEFYNGVDPDVWFIFGTTTFTRGEEFDNGPVVERGTCEQIRADNSDMR